MPSIEIDGKKFEAENGQTIIEVADQHGIYIPRFCYHKKLSVAANCRMCLIEVEGGRKPAPACATPVMDGMKIMTRSKATCHSQKAVMEFLLINHPLDCPICDQGGQCELQDLAVGYGYDSSKYNQVKTSVKDKGIGSLISTEMTRCIQCTRCVRFGEEIAGLREIGATGRGENMQIGTYVQRFVKSEVSANIIDLCPVGALLSKPFLYQARAWELNEQPSVASHDCLGSNTYAHTRRGQLIRVVPRENEKINQSWLSDRDRFSYLGINDSQRLLQSLIKHGDEWLEVSWEEALARVVDGIKSVIEQHGPEQLAALASPSSTTEECYLLQKIWRALGSDHLDHRLHHQDVADQDQWPLYLGFDGSLDQWLQQQSITLIGSNIRHEQPLLALRLRQVQRQGVTVMAVNMLDYDFNFSVDHQLIAAPDQFASQLAQIAKALSKQNKVSDAIAQLLRSVEISENAEKIAQQLKATDKNLLLVGADAHQHQQASLIRQLLKVIEELAPVQIAFLTEGANHAGAAIAGMLPHRQPVGQPVSRPGLATAGLLKQAMKAYLTLAIEPELDCVNPQLALDSLQQAEFVVCLSAYDSPVIKTYADVVLPISPFSETSGSYVNMMGQWQSFAAATPAKGEARPAWKVLRVLANLLGLENFDYMTSEALRDELRGELKQYYGNSGNSKSSFTASYQLSPKNSAQPLVINSPTNSATNLQLIMQSPIYGADAVLRRSEPLQQVFADEVNAIHLNSCTLSNQKLENGEMVNLHCDEKRLQLPVQCDDRLPDNCVLLYRTNLTTAINDNSELTLEKL